MYKKVLYLVEVGVKISLAVGAWGWSRSRSRNNSRSSSDCLLMSRHGLEGQQEERKKVRRYCVLFSEQISAGDRVDLLFCLKYICQLIRTKRLASRKECGC